MTVFVKIVLWVFFSVIILGLGYGEGFRDGRHQGQREGMEEAKRMHDP